MNDATRRAIRSAVQIGLVQAVIQFAVAFGAELTANQIAAITTLATPILALIQNLLEDQTSFPALLKAPASSGQNPTPDDGGTG